VLHKEIPFLRICAPLCAGIISGLYVSPDKTFIIIFGTVATAIFILSIFNKKPETNPLFGVAMTMAFFLCGLLLYTREKTILSILKPEENILNCTLSDYPAEKEKSYMLTLKMNGKAAGSQYQNLHGSILLYLKKDSVVPDLLPGDLLTVKCMPAEITSSGNPCSFDYRFFMENQGIKYSSYIKSENILKLQRPAHRKLRYTALIIRERIISMYRERGITGDRLALVAAITLGQKNMLDAEQKNYFIKAGVMHIMAVSGLHTVILSLFVFNVLFFLKGRFNLLRILVTILILWSFAYVTGLTASVLRATLMFTFLQAGNLMKRPVNGINSVLASAFLLILIKPSVLFDAGFLLSYSAVIYIISFYNDLYLKITAKNQIADKIWQSAAVSIVAQTGTLPLTIALFNRFPTYFLITNIIIVPLSSLLVIIGCIIPLVYPLKFLSHFLAVILGSLTGLTETLTRLASSLPMASVENLGMTSLECSIMALFLYLLSISLLRKGTLSPRFPVMALLLLFFAGTAREIFTRSTNEIIVYNTPGHSTIGIRTGRNLSLFTDTLEAAPDVKRHCSTLGLKLRMKACKDQQYLSAGNTLVLITPSLQGPLPAAVHPDLILLTGARPGISYGADSALPDEVTLVVTEGYPTKRLTGLLKRAKGGQIFFVRKSGAFIKRI
jgi:competence protein ComEC